MLLFMIHNDEASYASFGCRHRRRLDYALVPDDIFYFHPYIVASSSSGIRGDFRLHCESFIVEQDMKKKVRFNLFSLPPLLVRLFSPFLWGFFPAMSFHSSWKQKSSSGGKSSSILHRSFVRYVDVHRQGIKIFNQKSNLRNFFSSLFHNPVNLISTDESEHSMSNMNIEKKVMIKKKNVRKVFHFIKKNQVRQQPRKGWKWRTKIVAEAEDSEQHMLRGVCVRDGVGVGGSMSTWKLNKTRWETFLIFFLPHLVCPIPS